MHETLLGNLIYLKNVYLAFVLWVSKIIGLVPGVLLPKQYLPSCLKGLGLLPGA